MPTTANKGYNTPAFNTLVGTWGTGAGGLNETFQIQDNNMGGITSVALSNSNVTLSASQAQNLTITLTGTLLANVTVSTPCIGFFFVVNNTTGNFAVTLQANFGAGNIGSGLVVPQGMRLFIISDTTNGVQLAAAPSVGAPVGAIQQYAGSSAPTGWLLCYGQAISRTIYAALFSVISTTYGSGDGSTTFNLPDCRGRTMAGLDNMGGSDANRIDWSNTLGTSGGEQNHTIAKAELPNYALPVTDPSHHHTYTAGPTGVAVPGGATYVVGSGLGTYNTGDATTGISVNSGGSGTPANVMQPTILFNTIIKAV